MTATFLPVLDYGLDTSVADCSAPGPCVASTTQQVTLPPAAVASAELQTAGAPRTSQIGDGTRRRQQAASTTGRGVGPSRPKQQQLDSSQQQRHADELQQYARRRRKAVLLNMLRLLEHGAKDAEELQRLLQPMSGEELTQVAEERALAQLCGNPLCANAFMWDAPRWSVSGEAIERPEGECFCCKACSSYIAEMAKELGDSMKDLSAEALAAEAAGGMQQQGHPQQRPQQRQQSLAQKQRPKVAARGKEGPTMLANVQERVPSPMQIVTESADDLPDLDPTQLMAEVAAADKRYKQAGVVEGYVPRMQPRSLAAAAAARAGAVTGSEEAASLQMQSRSLASMSTGRDRDASTSQGDQHSLMPTYSQHRSASSSAMDADTSRGQHRDNCSSSQSQDARRTEAPAQLNTPNASSRRTILKKSSPQQQRLSLQSSTHAASSSRPGNRERSVRFAREVQYQEYPGASQFVSGTAAAKMDTSQPLLGDVVERRTSTRPPSTSQAGATSQPEAESSASGVQLGDAAERSEQPVLCFTLDDPSSVLEAGGGAEGQLGAQFGQLQLLGAGADDEAGEGLEADRDGAGAAAMPRALQLWFPPAAGGLGVPVQRAAPLQQSRQAPLVSHSALATPSSHHQEASSSKPLSAKGQQSTSVVQQRAQGEGQPQQRQQPRRFRPVCPPRRKVVMLDSPPDAAVQRQRGPATTPAPARIAAVPVQSVQAVGVSEALTAPPVTSSTPDLQMPAADARASAASAGGFASTTHATAASPGSTEVPAPAHAAGQAAAGSGRLAAAASSSDEDSTASEDDDASDGSSQEWYYDDQGETVQVSQQRQQERQRRGTAGKPQLEQQWSDSDADEPSSGEGELSEAGSDVGPTEAQQLSSSDDDSEEGDLRATAPFFGAPPKAFRAVLSPFGTLWTLVHAWVGESTRTYLAAEPGRPAAAAEAADSAASTAQQTLLQQGLSQEPGFGSRGPLTPPAATVHVRAALAEAVCAAVPGIMSDLCVAGVTESEVTKQLVALIRTFHITGPLPALPQQQWRLLALLFMRALSSVRVRALTVAFVGHEASARLDGMLAHGGFDAAQFAALFDLFVDD